MKFLDTDELYMQFGLLLFSNYCGVAGGTASAGSHIALTDIVSQQE